MIEEGLGIGAALRAAREKRGWTTQDAGSRLRLMARQIEAIEQEDFARLGQPVFARGFVRNYAKLLGLNPDELLEQMTRVKTAPVQETENLPFTPGDEFWKSPWVLGGIAAVILLLAIPISLYLWLNSEEEAPEAAAVEQAMPPLPPPAPVTEPVTQAPPAVPASAMPVAPAAAPQPAAMPPAAPAPVLPVAPAPAAANSPAAQPAAAKPPQAATPPAAQPAVVRPPLPFPVQVPPAPVKPAVQPSSQPVPPPAPPKPSAPAVQAPAPSALANVRMQFDQPAWVQVRDSTGRTLHAGLNPAGGSVEVSGKPPFFLVVGNAANVRVTYKGKLVDLKPYIDVTVARLTLNP